MLKKGDKLPAFELPNQSGEMINSKNWLGKPIVIFFYPKDNTPVCTIEACSFRDELENFDAMYATIIGISSDSVMSHEEFARKHRLNYSLLSDPEKEVARKFGLQNSLFGLLSPRATFVFDDHGHLIETISSRWNGKTHMKKALEILIKLG